MQQPFHVEDTLSGTNKSNRGYESRGVYRSTCQIRR